MGSFELPEGYQEIKRVNLQKDKKLAILVNVAALVIAMAMGAVGNLIVPLRIDTSVEGLARLLISMLAVLVGMIAYLVLHELVHGVCIKKYSGKKAKYGFTGLYAFAGSDAYFNKRQYVVIALTPVILFGVVFLLLNIFLPLKWFWYVYALQIINLSGAAGDAYITNLMRKMPKDVLTNDVGIEMIIYSAE